MNEADASASGPSPAPDPQGSGGEKKEIANPPNQIMPSQFPNKLIFLLDNKTVPDALWWLPDIGPLKGVFAINRKIFTKKVLDLAFNGNKWPSITRNFNRWGFENISYPGLDPHILAFHHPFFQPNRPDLLQTMIKNQSKSKIAIQEEKKKKKSILYEGGGDKSGGVAPPTFSTRLSDQLSNSPSSELTLSGNTRQLLAHAPTQSGTVISTSTLGQGESEKGYRQGGDVDLPVMGSGSTRQSMGNSGVGLLQNQQLEDILRAFSRSTDQQSLNSNNGAFRHPSSRQEEGLQQPPPQPRSQPQPNDPSRFNIDSAQLEELRQRLVQATQQPLFSGEGTNAAQQVPVVPQQQPYRQPHVNPPDLLSELQRLLSQPQSSSQSLQLQQQETVTGIPTAASVQYSPPPPQPQPQVGQQFYPPQNLMQPQSQNLPTSTIPTNHPAEAQLQQLLWGTGGTGNSNTVNSARPSVALANQPSNFNSNSNQQDPAPLSPSSQRQHSLLEELFARQAQHNQPSPPQPDEDVCKQS